MTRSLNRPTAVFSLICFSLVALTSINWTGARADAAVAAPSATPAATANWPRTMSLVYCWGTMDPNDIGSYCPCADLTLHKRPRDVDVFDCGTGQYYPAAGSWQKTGQWSTVTFDFPGQVTYTGTKLPNGTYEGMMYTPSGMYGVWRGEFLP